LGVVDKCLKSKNIISIKFKRKYQKNIMNVKEASEVCKDRVKWRVICGGKIKRGDIMIYCWLNLCGIKAS
jgi:hypothetical protein